uniref:Uncharacterized protein n=1 Tax=Romanomermis culicivorax TaxID=13658 RepID=A0A915J0P1_ROMCU
MVQPAITVVSRLPPLLPPDIHQLLPIFSIGINAQVQYAAWAKALGCQNEVSFFTDEFNVKRLLRYSPQSYLYYLTPENVHALNILTIDNSLPALLTSPCSLEEYKDVEETILNAVSGMTDDLRKLFPFQCWNNVNGDPKDILKNFKVTLPRVKPKFRHESVTHITYHFTLRPILLSTKWEIEPQNKSGKSHKQAAKSSWAATRGPEATKAKPTPKPKPRTAKQAFVLFLASPVQKLTFLLETEHRRHSKTTFSMEGVIDTLKLSQEQKQ